jgi:hypothetical protein
MSPRAGCATRRSRARVGKGSAPSPTCEADQGALRGGRRRDVVLEHRSRAMEVGERSCRLSSALSSAGGWCCGGGPCGMRRQRRAACDPAAGSHGCCRRGTPTLLIHRRQRCSRRRFHPRRCLHSASTDPSASRSNSLSFWAPLSNSSLPQLHQHLLNIPRPQFHSSAPASLSSSCFSSVGRHCQQFGPIARHEEDGVGLWVAGPPNHSSHRKSTCSLRSAQDAMSMVWWMLTWLGGC